MILKMNQIVHVSTDASQIRCPHLECDSMPRYSIKSFSLKTQVAAIIILQTSDKSFKLKLCFICYGLFLNSLHGLIMTNRISPSHIPWNNVCFLPVTATYSISNVGTFYGLL